MATTTKRPLFTRLSDKLYLRLRHRGAWDSATAEAADPARGFESLRGKQYALLTTFRKSGEPVPTPVWFGIDDGRIYVRCEDDSGKAKRLRANPHVRVAPCNNRGRPYGPAVEARARLLTEPGDRERAERAIQANFGLGRRVFERGGETLGVTSTYLEIEPQAE